MSTKRLKQSFRKFIKKPQRIITLGVLTLLLVATVKFGIKTPKTALADVYLGFDEGYGTSSSVNDKNGSVSAGSITNAVWKQEDLCKTGKCLYFDGAGDYVSFADDTDLDFTATNTFTITGWFRNPAIATNPDYLVTKHQASTAGGYKIYMDSDGDLVFGIDDDGTWNTTDIVGDDQSKNYDDNKWHFFAAVKNGTTGIYLYVDGVLIDQDTSLAETGSLANASPLYIGIDADGASNGWSGFIDEIKIVRIAKNATEIATDYLGSTNSTTGNGPIAHWSLNESTSNTCTGGSNDACDYSGSGNDGAWGGNTTSTTGKFGNGAAFDGTTDYISITDNASVFEPANDSSISLWVNMTTLSRNNTLIAKDGTGGGGYYIQIDNTNTLQFGWRNSSDTLYTVNYPTSFTQTATWIHIEAVKSGNFIYIYLNGVLGTNFTATTGTMKNTTDPLYLGSEDATTNSMAGKLDDVRIYDYARSSSQILEDMLGFPPSGSAAMFAPTQNYLSNGLIAYWKMDENTGSNANDSSGNGNTQVLTGMSSDWTSGKFGSTLNFSGAGHEAKSTQTFSTETQGTLAAWIYPTSIGTTYRTIIAGGDDAGTDKFIWLNVTDGGNVQFYVRENTSANEYAISTTTTLSANNWYHIAVTQSPLGAKIYINGAPQTTSVDTQIGTADGTEFYDDIVGIDNTTLGYRDRDTNSDYFVGKIDEARIYNRPLSPTEVSQLYNWAPGPVGYWKMDENTGTSSVNDSSGNTNTGTLTGTASTDWTSGKLGSALNFDASNNSVNAGNGSTLTAIPATAGMTVSTWMYARSNGEGGTNGRIMEKTNGSSRGYQLYLGTTSGKVTFDAYFSGTDLSAAETTHVSMNSWHHVAVTWDGSLTATNVKFYIDGVPSATTSTTNGTGTRTDDTTGDNMYIGNSSDGAHTFDGMLDDFKVYNYIRTQSQIVEDMNGGHPAPGSPIGSSVAKWKFDEGYGTTANDNSINSNSLTLSTASWTNNGKSGKAFNGLTNVRLSRTDDADLDFAASDDATFSVWFKSDSATNPSANEYLLEKGGNIATDAIGYAIYTSAASDGLICFGIDDDATSFPEDSVCSTNDLYDNTWHHIVAKKTGTSRLDLYVDGKPNGTPDTSISATGTLENAATFYIGDTNGTDGTDEFLGDIDEVEIFRSSLTETQITSLYNAGSMTSIGSISTDSTNITSNSDTNSYCPPGQGSTCTPPLGIWKLDENTGTNAYDTSTNGYNGTLTSGPTWQNGKSGSALSFDGVDDYVDIGDVFYSDVLTISFWVNLRSVHGTDGKAIILKRNGSGITASNNEFVVQANSTRKLEWATWTSGGSGITNTVTNTALNLNQWYRVDVVNGGNGSTARIYINGVLDVTSSTLGNTIGNSTSRLQFGTRQASNNNTYFDGLIDQVQIYNYVRTPAQIAWDYNLGNPVAWWKLDECNSTTINDSMGNISTGTVVPGSGSNSAAGSCSSGTTSEMWNDGTTGKRNGSLGFDGTDDAVTFSANSKMNLNNGGTISAWIYPNSTGENSFGRIIDKSSDTSGTGGYIMGMSGNSFFGEMTNGTNTSCTATSNSVPFSTWSLVTWTFDGTNWKLYVNGNLITTCSTVRLPATTSLGVTIGNRQGATDRTFDGLIDDVRLYNYPLTDYQVKTLMTGGAVRFGL